MNIADMILAEQLMDYAEKNYTTEGWDFLVECWTVEEIEEELISENIHTLEGAKKYFSKLVSIWDERRRYFNNI